MAQRMLVVLHFARFDVCTAEIKSELNMGIHASPRSVSHALPSSTAAARPLSAHTMAPLYTAHPHTPFPSSASAFAPARPMTAAEQPQFHPQQEIMCSFLRGLFSMLDSVFNAMAKSYDKRLKVGTHSYSPGNPLLSRCTSPRVTRCGLVTSLPVCPPVPPLDRNARSPKAISRMSVHSACVVCLLCPVSG